MRFLCWATVLLCHSFLNGKGCKAYWLPTACYPLLQAWYRSVEGTFAALVHSNVKGDNEFQASSLICYSVALQMLLSIKCVTMSWWPCSMLPSSSGGAQMGERARLVQLSRYACSGSNCWSFILHDLGMVEPVFLMIGMPFKGLP